MPIDKESVDTALVVILGLLVFFLAISLLGVLDRMLGRAKRSTIITMKRKERGDEMEAAEGADAAPQGAEETSARFEAFVARARRRYRIMRDVATAEVAIVCGLCGSISYNPNDIANLYCARCHVFHTRNLPPAA